MISTGLAPSSPLLPVTPGCQWSSGFKTGSFPAKGISEGSLPLHPGPEPLCQSMDDIFLSTSVAPLFTLASKVKLRGS